MHVHVHVRPEPLGEDDMLYSYVYMFSTPGWGRLKPKRHLTPEALPSGFTCYALEAGDVFYVPKGFGHYVITPADTALINFWFRGQRKVRRGRYSPARGRLRRDKSHPK